LGGALGGPLGGLASSPPPRPLLRCCYFSDVNA
jgi:hypothetical protein